MRRKTSLRSDVVVRNASWPTNNFKKVGYQYVALDQKFLDWENVVSSQGVCGDPVRRILSIR